MQRQFQIWPGLSQDGEHNLVLKCVVDFYSDCKRGSEEEKVRLSSNSWKFYGEKLAGFED
jgi:hypothetical protein